MYKNIVPLPEVSEDPPVGPQINTGSEIGVRGRSVCGGVEGSLKVIGQLGSSLCP